MCFEHDYCDEKVKQARLFLVGKRQMKFLLIPLGILWAMAAIGVGQEPEHSTRAIDDVRGREHSKFDALQRKDNASLDALCDDALMQVDPEGSLWTKAEYLAHLNDATVQRLRIAPQSMTVRTYGDVAIVIGIYEEKGLKAGHPYLHRCRFIDTWALKKGKWVCIAAAETSAVS